MRAREILHKHNLVRTSCRQSIIDTIVNAGFAISEEEIKQKIEGTYDRTTFYRSFKTLIENNIIHKIVVDNQLVKYALTENNTESKKHVHFCCNQCGVVECLPEIEIKVPPLPAGYQHKETELIIKGVCSSCNH
jgi:Fur family ferric uptake transcriptional regulator